MASVCKAPSCKNNLSSCASFQTRMRGFRCGLRPAFPAPSRSKTRPPRAAGTRKCAQVSVTARSVSSEAIQRFVIHGCAAKRRPGKPFLQYCCCAIDFRVRSSHSCPGMTAKDASRLRGACRRTRIRATRWLAMTERLGALAGTTFADQTIEDIEKCLWKLGSYQRFYQHRLHAE